MTSAAWRSLNLNSAELRLDFTLQAGQSFRWHRMTGESTEDATAAAVDWTGIFDERIWTLRQDVEGGRLLYRVHPEPQSEREVAACENTLDDYFQLNRACLADLYDKWSASDVHFRRIAPQYPGVRVLRQDPVENLFSFLCSSNNNIKRITGMVQSLCEIYGRHLISIDGRNYHGFPDVESLAADGVAERLRAEKFGYRAAFIQRTARKLVDEHRRTESSSSSFDDVGQWLRSLRTVSYEEARSILMSLPGVGPKVADCVCLMSLDKTRAVPVDTHIFKLASHLYFTAPDDGSVGAKSLTKKKYEQIGNHFNGVFGEYAGWAHSVLFTSDLSQFRTDKAVQVDGKRKRVRESTSKQLTMKKSSN